MICRHVGARAVALVGLGLSWVACGSGPESPRQAPANPSATHFSPSDESNDPGSQGPKDGYFVDVAADVGLDFVHHNGMSGQLYYSEMMGGGVVLFDFDGDGDLDVYCVGGGELSPAGVPETTGGQPIGRLYRNDLISGVPVGTTGGPPDESRRLRFADITDGSGLDVGGYGMGAVAFDYDGDGLLDLYVTQSGPNRLFRNRGDGTFEETGATSGTDLATWSVPAVVLDFDRDGWLDLFVGNYVDFSLATNKRCTDALGQANYCGPLAYLPLADHLLRNRGDGTFENITQASGIGVASGRSLGALAGDFNADGRPDLYVANDGTANFLWLQTPEGRFEERAVETGVAVNGQGLAEASMGVAAADIDADGDPDLVLGHLSKETNTLLVNQGRGAFHDVSTRSGLGPPSLPWTTFGVSWLDFDNDGWLDLLTSNGAVKIIKAQALAGEPHPLRQRNQLFRNRGDGTFEDVSSSAGLAFGLSEVSRGTAVGDLDNDGDLDVVLSNNNGPIRLLLNTVGQSRRFVAVEVVDAGQAPPGTEVRLELSDGRRLVRWIHLGSSYASADDPRLIFGLGDDAEARRLEVRWPDGEVETWDTPLAGQWTTLQRGSGRPL